MISKLWFNLRTHVDCMCCGRRLRRAVFPGKLRIGSVLVPAISHGLCPTCALLKYGVRVKPKKTDLVWMVAACGLMAISVVWPNFWITLAAIGCALIGLRRKP